MTRGIQAKRILVVDDEPMIVSLLSAIFREKGWSVIEAGSGTDGIDRLSQCPFDVILTDLVMPGDSGIDLLRAAKEVLPDTEVILMTGFATADTAIEAMRNGAFHYLMKPLKTEEVVHLAEKAYEQRMLGRENRFLKSEMGAAYHVQSLVGDSEPVLRLVESLRGFAAVDEPVLLCGERGTGRGFFARFIHFNSRRAAELCVPVHCLGVPPGTLAADLFGRPGNPGERTSPPREGKMELANHGTLYLSNIEGADREILERLERFLLTKTILLVGDTVETPMDIRIVASSAVSPREMALREKIPPGLLKAFERGTVLVPPLRDHREDIPLLLHHFLREANRERKKPLRGFTASALSALESHDWPGNVRELRELVYAIASKKKQGTMIDATDIPPAILYRRPRRQPPGVDP